MKKLLTICAVVTLVLAVSGLIRAGTINVPADYTLIQAAITAANPGDTIMVAAGMYNERLTINKSLTLLGAQAGVDPTPDGVRTDPLAESIVTEAGLSTPNPDVLVEIPSGVTSVTIDGFTLNGDQTNTTADTSVVRCWDDNITISNNIIDGMYAVLYKGNDYLNVSQNRMVVNKLGVTVQPNPATNVTISDNVFSLGGSPVGGESAIYMTSTSDSSINGNTATGFVNGRGAGGSNVTNLLISGNSFIGNNDGISFWGNTTFVTICKNVLSDSLRYGINIKGQDISIFGNVIENNGSVGVNIALHVIDTRRVNVNFNKITGNVNYGMRVNINDEAETVDATKNWWGTTDLSSIAAMIDVITPGYATFDPPLLTGYIQMAFGGNRLAETQNNDGGWDWPLDDGDPTSGSAANTIGPIAMGLAKAYLTTGDSDLLVALQDAATFLQAKTNNFSPSDGYLAAELDRVLVGTTNVDHVTTYFYDELAAGMYDRDGLGTLYDSAAYVQWNRDRRFAQNIPNLAAWDLGMGLVGAASCGVTGADLQAWIDGVKAEVNELDGNAYYDVIGLAGAVYGLAFVGEDFDPTSGEHSAASNLADLADILASYQISESGGFTWNSNYVIPYQYNETIQETAYATLALLEIGGHTDEVGEAVQYLRSMQLCTGGWENYVGSPTGENNEVTAEALWAIAAAQPSIQSITVVPDLVQVENSVVLTAIFTNPDPEDTFTATIDWGDGSQTTPDSIDIEDGNYRVTATHTCNQTGVFTVILTVTDDDGDSDQMEFRYLVVYDPEGGFVTGGGWINSPEGAYAADPLLTGEATFGFVSKYKKGAEAPTGNTEFQFHAADLNFHSSSYEWLLVTGSDYARFKGAGTINGMGDYKFMLWAGDDDPDTFRVRIWWEDDSDSVEHVVYDNGFDQAIGGGSIVVHTPKK